MMRPNLSHQGFPQSGPADLLLLPVLPAAPHPLMNFRRLSWRLNYLLGACVQFLWTRNQEAASTRGTRPACCVNGIVVMASCCGEFGFLRWTFYLLTAPSSRLILCSLQRVATYMFGAAEMGGA